MEEKKRKSINYTMRSLHRDVGFFVIGLIIIYSLSGIVLIFRDTDFLKHDITVEETLSPNLDAHELGKELHVKEFEILRTDAEYKYFKNGTYNKATGVVTYSKKELPSFLVRLTAIHKSSSKYFSHWVSTLFGIMLFFLAISSLWMFKPNTKAFRRGILILGAGLAVAILLFVLN